MTAEAVEVAWLACSCCGKGIRDTPEENTDHGEHPNPHDVGFGMCVECGGDKREKGTSEAAVRKRLGWAGEVFYDARIEILGKKLTGANLEKLNAMTYAQKVAIIARMIERGVMT